MLKNKKATVLISVIALLFLIVSCNGGTAKTGISSSLPTASASITPPDPFATDFVDTYVPQVSPKIEITEIMVKNTVGVSNSGGERFGWIEIRNTSNGSVSLGDYSLLYSDKKWDFPDMDIAAGEYAFFFMTGREDPNEVSFLPDTSGSIEILLNGKDAARVYYANPNPDHSFLIQEKKEVLAATPGYALPHEADVIVISEIMTKNDSYPIDGELCDWIELYNSGDKDIFLGSYYLSDSSKNYYMSRLPDKVLRSGEYTVIACGRDLSFSLSNDETVYLTRRDGVQPDSFDVGTIPSDQSRLAGGKICEYPTPGYPDGRENNLKLRQPPKGLIINEIVASNSKYSKASDNKYYDLIELYNNSDESINLSDYYISDKKKNLQLAALPNVTLAPGKYKIIYAAGEYATDSNGFMPFSISSSGETIYLTDKNGKIADVMAVPECPCDRSYGRADGKLLYFATPTPGSANGKGFEEMSSAVTANIASGYYKDEIKVKLSSADGGKIYYTVDGSKPTASSKLYSGEEITVNSTTAIRAINMNGERIPSAVSTFNYLYFDNDYTLDVIKLSISKSDFSDLYTNFLSHKEFEVNAAYFVDGKEAFSVDCGIKISGRSSSYFIKKSFLLKFRSIYGSSNVGYKVFDGLEYDDYDTLVIRSGSSASVFYHPFLSDEFITSVISDDLLVQAYKPVDLYINDEYYGVYYIREKVNKEFVARHEDVSETSVTIVEEMKYLHTGSSFQGWNELWTFVQNNDLSLKSNYDYLESKIDMQSVADYYITLAWECNIDSGNVRLYKSSAAGGKWRMMMYDHDMAFGNYGANYGYGTVNSMLGKTYTTYSSTLGSYNIMIVKLLKNTEFRKVFYTRLKYHVENTFATERVLPMFNAMVDEIKHDFEYNVERWQGLKMHADTSDRYYKNMAEWEKTLDNVRTYWLCDKRLEMLVKEFIEVTKATKDEVNNYLGSQYVQYVK